MSTQQQQHVAIFDGTSAYVIPAQDLEDMNPDEIVVIGRFEDLDTAQAECDTYLEMPY